ncbi:hypothetical protein GCM10027346_13660 [Hymenobacter seoulensis]
MSRVVEQDSWAARGGPRPAVALTISRWLWWLPLVGLALLPACAYDSAEELLSQAPVAPACDSTAITFSASVAPLLQQRCVSCHNNALRNGNVSLETYAQVQQVAASGRLLGAVTHAPGFAPMPQNEARLPTCDLATLRQWVRAGMPNN